MKFLIVILLLMLTFATILFLMTRDSSIDLSCSTTLVQKKDNIDNDDLFSITPTITFYKNGQGVIHVYGEADDDEKTYKVNRTVTFDFNILGKSTYEITVKSVIKSTLDKVPQELDAQYFPALSKGAVRIVSFSRLNENLIVSISSGAYFICAKN